jgi:hypothetical protein
MLGSWGLPQAVATAAPSPAAPTQNSYPRDDDDNDSEVGGGGAAAGKVGAIEIRAADAAVEWALKYAPKMQRDRLLARAWEVVKEGKQRWKQSASFIDIVTANAQTCVVGMQGYLAAKQKIADLVPPPPAPTVAPTARTLHPAHHQHQHSHQPPKLTAPVVRVGQPTFMSALASWAKSACIDPSSKPGSAASSKASTKNSNGNGAPVVTMATDVELAWSHDYSTWHTRQGGMRTCTLEVDDGECIQLSKPAYRVLGLHPATSYVFKARCLCLCTDADDYDDSVCKMHVTQPGRKGAKLYAVCSPWSNAVALKTTPMPSR